MKAEDKSKLVKVYSGTPWEAELIRGLLASNHIQSMLKDGIVANVIFPKTAVDIAVMVNESDYEAAMQILREREKTQLPE